MARGRHASSTDAPVRSLRQVVILNWRDEEHPEAGGSERYVGEVARGLVARGVEVTMLCSDHGQGPREEVRDGVRYRRRGGRLGVYPRALLRLATMRPDAVVDVSNGIPFFSRLATRAPVVVLVHHVHREQWPVATGPVTARVGWWLESRAAPRFFRGCRYVTVSGSTHRELAVLGVRADDVRVVHNGVEPPAASSTPSSTPRVSVVSRLVPHKQVEHAVRAVAALLPSHPDLHLDVVGDGYWRPQVEALVASLGVEHAVTVHGHVSQEDKHRLVSSSWVHLCPSLKEGWGLVVVEAGTHAVPTIAYASAGGVRESVVDGVTGVLCDDEAGLTEALASLLDDDERRERMGKAARDHADRFTWAATVEGFAAVLDEAVARGGQRVP